MNLLNNKNLKWKHYNEGDKFDYPIKYSESILDAREDGRLEILVKWEPNCYCHFHRHTAETSSVVLEGELHVTDIDIKTGKEIGKRLRAVGDFAHKEPGDVHMEQGGANGALVLFNIYAPEGDGKLAESLKKDGSVVSASTMARILRKRSK
jgi:quercetin dioxygenase-like cupin family protein